MRESHGHRTIRCAWLISAISLTACTHDSPPQLNRNPAHRISIVGTFPTGIEIKLTAVWQTTVVSDACAPKMAWPVGTRFPRQASFPVSLEQRSDDQAVWETWWDLLAPDKCGWQLAALELKADRSAAEFAAHAATNLSDRIAFVCLHSCLSDSPRANSDPSEAVTQYCKFSILGKSDLGINPCVYGSDGRFAGPNSIPFKEQHILQPGQQVMRFALIDVDSPAGGS